MLARLLRVFSAAGVVLGMAGCANQHQANVQSATLRWQSIRSSQMMALASQQFATGDLDQAHKTVAEALSVDPRHAGLLVIGGRIGLERGELERAGQWLAAAIQVDPKMAQAHYYQGFLMQRWEQFDAALASYQRAYELQSDNVAHLLAASEMLVALDRTDEALGLLQSKLGYFEHNGGIRDAMAKLCVLQQRFDEACQFYSGALMLQPDDLQIREELAFAQLAAGQSEQAVATLELLCAQHAVRDRRYLRLALAQAYRQTGRVAQARSIYVDLARSDPSYAEPWRQLAELGWASDDLATTLTAAGRLIRLEPQQSPGYLWAGLVWARRDRVDLACELFARGATADGGTSPAAMAAASFLEQMGQGSKDAMTYRKVLGTSSKTEPAG